VVYHLEMLNLKQWILEHLNYISKLQDLCHVPSYQVTCRIVYELLDFLLKHALNNITFKVVSLLAFRFHLFPTGVDCSYFTTEGKKEHDNPESRI